MMNAGIIVAMESEQKLLRKAGIPNVELSGIGKVNATITATKMILEKRPTCIINSGVAGSVNKDVKVGHIVVGERVAYHDVWCGEGNLMGQVEGLPQYFNGNSHLLQLTKEAAEELANTENTSIAGAGKVAGDNITKVHFGLITSGDQFYISQQEDQRILKLYPQCLACDMESAAIAQVCHKFGVPFISIRIISDEHLTDAGQKESYSSFWHQAPLTSFNFLNRILEKI